MPYVYIKKYVPMRPKNIYKKNKAPVRRWRKPANKATTWKPRYKKKWQPKFRPRKYQNYRRTKNY